MCSLFRAIPRERERSMEFVAGDDGGNDVNIIPAASLGMSLPDQIEQAGIHLGWFIAAPIAQEPVKLVQTVLLVAAIPLEGDFSTFVGMNKIESQCPGFGESAVRRKTTSIQRS